MNHLLVHDFIKSHGGTHMITKVLIANNGLAAVKAIRSIRSWCYDTFQDEHAIQLVAMATPDDLRINAEYIRLADEFIEVPSGAGNNNYANVKLIVSVAKKINAHAVWPGWGYASENPALPEALEKENIVFIGPSASAMGALGDKIASTIIAQSSDVNCIPWSGSAVTIDNLDDLNDDVFAKACVKDVDDLQQHAERIGYPLMVKASEGGGGKGIRKVEQQEDLLSSYSQVVSEVPGSPIFVMRMGTDCHHLEVQIIADRYGNTVALDGRDCSIQRRHQKLIEEGPATVTSRDQFHEMEAAAARLAKKVGYSVAGTVEFLYTEGEYYFLEMNPRLQVEHPVTEGIVGINLPACMLMVAMGIPLNRIPDIRAFYLQDDLEGESEIDFENDPRAEPRGHVIAARVTAENADEGFQPTSGSIQELTFRSTNNAWAYFSVGSSGGIHEFSDSQFGHIFAWGPDRSTARRNLIFALKGITILGEIRTSIQILIEILEHDHFDQNTFSTAWLDQYIIDRKVVMQALDSVSMSVSSEYMIQDDKSLDIDESVPLASYANLAAKILPSGASSSSSAAANMLMSVDSTSSSGSSSIDMSHTFVAIACGALSRGHKIISDRRKEFLNAIDRGQLPTDDTVATEFTTQIIYDEIKYLFTGCVASPTDYILSLNDSSLSANVRELSDSGLLISIGGRSCVCYINEEKTGFRIVVNNRTYTFITEENDPRVLRTIGAGKLYRYLVPSGSKVKEGEAIAEIEVMKMILTLKAQIDGIITFTKSEGTFVEQDDVIARMQLPEGTVVKKSTVSSDQFPASLNPFNQDRQQDLGDEERRLLKYMVSVLSGYQPQPSGQLLTQHANVWVNEMQSLMSNPRLCIFHFNEIFSPLAGRIPTTLYDDLQAQIDAYEAKINKNTKGRQRFLSVDAVESDSAFPHERMNELVSDYLTSLTVESEQTAATALLQPLNDFIRSYQGGTNGYMVRVVASLLDQYYEVATQFDHDWPWEDIVSELRVHFKEKPDLVFDLLRSHGHVEYKNQLIMSILNSVVSKQVNKFLPQLTKIESLRRPEFADVSIHCKYLMLSVESDDFVTQFFSVEEKLVDAADLLEQTKPEQASEILAPYVLDEHDQVRDDVLASLLAYEQPSVAFVAMQIFIRRQYAEYNIKDIQCRQLDNYGTNVAIWQYQLTTQGSGVESGYPGSSNNELSSASGDHVIWRVDSVDSLAFEEVKNKTSGLRSTKMGATMDLAALEQQSQSSTTNSVTTKDDQWIGGTRQGYVVSWRNSDNLQEKLASFLDQMLKEFKEGNDEQQTVPKSILYIAVPFEQDELADDACVDELEQLFVAHEESLHRLAIRRVSFLVLMPGGMQDSSPRIFTFRSNLGFKEDPYVRHIEPTMADYLELNRLSNFEISVCPTNKTNIHIYQADPAHISDQINSSSSGSRDRKLSFAKLHSGKSSQRTKDSKSKFFARCIIPLAKGEAAQHLEIVNFVEMHILRSINALEFAKAKTGTKQCAGTHVFLNMLGALAIDLDVLVDGLNLLMQRVLHLLSKQQVYEIELSATTTSEKTGKTQVNRVLISFPARVCVRIAVFSLENDVWVNQTMQDNLIYAQIANGPNVPYATRSLVEAKRQRAETIGTSYAYDFPILIEKTVSAQWHQAIEQSPTEIERPEGPLVELQELIMQTQGNETKFVLSSDVAVGTNVVGMVAWLLNLRTPEYPKGREIVLLANDITVVSGSFGVLEDKVYEAASTLARKRGIPLLYIAANSGARIGLAKEVIDLFKVKWINPQEPSKGFEYIYLEEDQHQQMVEAQTKSVVATRVDNSDGSVHYRITDIIGREDGIGVENLKGSGTIASEMSAAYDQVVTLSYVTGRAVGIGAYLVRLGQRVVQCRNAPILLTGYAALNRLVGHHVYTSNLQIGGPKIMFRNGVSHLTVNNDLEGMEACLGWIGFLPRTNDSMVPMGVSNDDVNRNVDFCPSKGEAYDPRLLLQGAVVSGVEDAVVDDETGVDVSDVSSIGGQSLVPAGMTGLRGLSLTIGSRGLRSITSNSTPDLMLESGQKILSGFFDHGSFVETLNGWAETVVCGRARLGGIPTGVIAVETRTVQRIRPADPADEASNEYVTQQPGQVWFPDSAYKTAQSIQDFSKEGLPLIIFANWRGFSGGMRDMFDEVLKYGSYIVDNLRTYKQPVFVYMPPYAELRGGAWVVLDATINKDMMEMYADPRARAGILEPEGIQEIKFRAQTIRATMMRTDSQCKQLHSELSEVRLSLSEIDSERDPQTAQQLENERIELEKKLAERQDQLFPVYQQLATHFCALHDTPERMRAKDVIRKIVPWEESRRYFFWRMKRRLLVHDLVNQAQKLDDTKEYLELAEHLNGFVAAKILGDDIQVVQVEEDGEEAVSDEAVATWLEENQDIVDEEWMRAIKGEGFQMSLSQMLGDDPELVADALMEVLRSSGMNKQASAKFLGKLKENMT